MDEDQRRLEARIHEVLVVGADLIGQEHALVDDGARRQRHAIGADVLVVVLGVDAAGDHLAQQVEPRLVFLVVLDLGGTADEDLAMERLGRGDVGRLGQRGIVDRHVAEADQRQAFGLRRLGDDLVDVLARCRVLRHEPVADAVVPDRRQFDALLGHLLAEEAVRNLHQHAGAVAHQRIGADGAAMREVLEHGQTVLDDLVRLHALHLGDEADAAGIVLVARIVEALGGRQTGNLRRSARLTDAPFVWAGTVCSVTDGVKSVIIMSSVPCPRQGGFLGRCRRAKPARRSPYAKPAVNAQINKTAILS